MRISARRILMAMGAACVLFGCGRKEGDAKEGSAPAGRIVRQDEFFLPAEEAEKDAADSKLPTRENKCSAVDFTLKELLNPDEGEFLFTLTPGHEDEIWYYDEFYHLERYADGEWKELEMKGGFCGNTSYFEIGGEYENLKLNWSYLYVEQETGEDLEPGIYCVVKEVFPQRDGTLNELLKQYVPEEGEALQKTGPDIDAGEMVYAVFEIKDKPG